MLKKIVHKKAWVFLYGFIYFPWFFLLEKLVTSKYYMIQCKLDNRIPFCEYFVIPYILWFVYVAVTFLWFYFKESDEMFYRFCAVMFGGMTIALLIYTFFPNGIRLRSDINPDKNIYTWLTSVIYKSDTPTNVFPSLHVYTSVVIGIFTVKVSKKGIKNYKAFISVVMSILIVLSTVFLKQHSVLDLVAGTVMAFGFSSIAFTVEGENIKRKHNLVRI